MQQSLSTLMLLERCVDKAAKKRMSPIGTGFEFRVILHTYIEITVVKLDSLNESSVGRKSGEAESRALERLTILIVELVTMAMTLGYLTCAIAAVS